MFANAVKRCAQKVGQTFGVAKMAAPVRAAVPAAVTALALGGVAGSAHAQSGFTIDPAPIVTVITSGVTVVSAIGMAVLSLVVVIKMFVWVRRVIS